MDIFCTVEGQRLRIDTPKKIYAIGSNDFVRFLFTLSSDWDGLLTFVQFRQGNDTSDEYLVDATIIDEEGNEKTYPSVTLPGWPKCGLLTMTLHGTGRATAVGTTNYVMMNIAPNGYIGIDLPDEQKTLYEQLAFLFLKYRREWELLSAQLADFDPTAPVISNAILSMLDGSTPYVLRSDWIVGGLNDNGEETVFSKSIRTGFYPISQNAQIYFDGVTKKSDETYGRNAYFHFYDAAKNHILRQTSGRPPAGTCYVRLTYAFNSNESKTVNSYGIENFIDDYAVVIKSPNAQKFESLLPITLNAIKSLRNYSEPDVASAKWTIGGLAFKTANETIVNNSIRSEFFPISSTTLIRFNGVERGDDEDKDRRHFFFFFDKNYQYLGYTSNGTVPDAYYVRMVYAFGNGVDKTVEDYGLAAFKSDYSVEFRPASTRGRRLNILVLGNSFSQGAFAYLPVILKNMEPTLYFNIGVAYEDSADISDHVEKYKAATDEDYEGDADEKYNTFNYWNSTFSKWSYYIDGRTESEKAGGLNPEKDRRKTIEEILHFSNWDIVYVQPAGSVYPMDDEKFNRIYGGPTRELLRILQSELTDFRLIAGSWLPTPSTISPGEFDKGESAFPPLDNVLERMCEETGCSDYVPIATAFQSARTNDALQELGDAIKTYDEATETWVIRVDGNLICADGKHMQSGLPVLLAGYTIALKLAQICSFNGAGIYGDPFVPTDEACQAIDAKRIPGPDDNPLTGKPRRMTHGNSVGINTSYIYLAQEIATAAIKNPHNITDFSTAEIELEGTLSDVNNE